MKTNSELETFNIGEILGSLLTKGDVVCMDGDIGAGKTVITKGIAKSLEIDDLITSPTFTIVNEHTGKYDLYHFDVYRLESGDELLDIGFEDYLGRNGIVIIEWAEFVKDVIPENRIWIKIANPDFDNSREIEIDFGINKKIKEEFERRIENG